MSLVQFLESVRAARSSLFGRMLESREAGQPLDAKTLDSAMTHTADIWFTPELVKHFDEADFRFLPDKERTELTDAVDKFRKLTTEVRGSSPTAAQIAQGYDLFGRINNIPAPYFGEEPDLRRVADATREVRWPDYVLWTDVRFGTDSGGDPAVWIWFVLKDDVEIESPAVQAELARVREGYRRAIQHAGIDRWPYFSARTRSEVKSRAHGDAA